MPVLRRLRHTAHPTLRLGSTLAALAGLAGGIANGSVHAQDAPTMTATALSPDGFSIAYETLGEGSPALVFVHGWSCDRSYWAAQLEPFSRDFRVVAVDLAGQGELPNAAIDQVSRPRPAARRSCSCRGSAISS